MFLAVAATPRPRHSFQSRFGDGTLAGLTYSELTVFDPNQRLFDCPQKVTIALAQGRLEGHPRFLTPPIGKISGTSLCPSRIEQGSELARQQLIAPGHQ